MAARAQTTIDRIAEYRRLHGVSLAEARRIVCEAEAAEEAAAAAKRRHPRATLLAAATAGLRETMTGLGHQPEKLETLSALADVVTLCCGRCLVALSAVIEHDAERVVLEGPAMQLRCGGAR